jgi:hypothetical protein
MISDKQFDLQHDSYNRLAAIELPEQIKSGEPGVDEYRRCQNILNLLDEFIATLTKETAAEREENLNRQKELQGANQK